MPQKDNATIKGTKGVQYTFDMEIVIGLGVIFVKAHSVTTGT